ncbi:MAG: hypothetical protein V3W06_06350, partial [Acidimicrobiia bacterium]
MITPGCAGACGGAATFDIAEDTPLTGLAKNTTKRLRIEISAGAAFPSVLYRLEVSQANPASCAAATYTRVDSSTHWNMVTATSFADGDPTSNIVPGLTDAPSKTFVAGQLKESNDQTSGITLSGTEFTEIEYAVQATASATDEATYCFRLTDAGTATNFTYTEARYGKVTLAAAPPPDPWFSTDRDDDVTTTNIWKEYSSLTVTPTGANEDWIVIFTIKTSSNDTGDTVEVRAQVNEVTEWYSKRESEDASERNSNAGFVLLRGINSAQTVDLDFKLEQTSIMATAYYASMVAIRLDVPGADFALSPVADGPITVTSTRPTYNNLASVTLNPASAGEYLVIGTFSGSVPNTDDSISFRLEQGGDLIPDVDGYKIESPDTGDTDGHLLFRVVNYTTGSKTWNLQGAKDVSADVSWNATYRKLAVIRLTGVYDFQYEETPTNNAPGGTYTDLESITFTAENAEYAFLASTRASVNDTATICAINLPDETESDLEVLEAKDSSDDFDMTVLAFKTLTAGPQTIELQGKQNATTCTFDNSNLLIIKPSNPTTTIGDGTSPANKSVAPSSTNNAVNAFTLSTDSGTDTVTALTVTFTGTAVADVAASGVKIYEDNGSTPNEWDATDTLIGTASFSGTTASFTGLSIAVNTTAIQYLVTYDIAAGA